MPSRYRRLRETMPCRDGCQAFVDHVYRQIVTVTKAITKFARGSRGGTLAVVHV